MACDKVKQREIRLSAKAELKRLTKLHNMGYEEDIDNGISDILAQIKNMQAIVNQKPEELTEYPSPENITEQFIAEMGSTLDVKHNGARADKLQVGTVLDRGRDILIRAKDGKQYSFVKGSNRSKSTKSNRYITVEGMQEYSQDRILFNEPGNIMKVTKDHKELKENIYQDQRAALELFDSLVEDGNTEHSQELRQLLEKITDPQSKILNEFKVYINRKAKTNKGMAQLYGKDQKMILDISDSGNTTGGMSAAEVYVHEMIHMSVEAARLHNKGPLANTLIEMHKLYEKASKEITVEKLIERGEDPARAKRNWEYVFNNKDGNGISEFMAYGMTNEPMKKALSEMKLDNKTTVVKGEGIWSKMAQLLVDLYDGIRKWMHLERDKDTADEKLGWLVSKMWAHNNQAVDNSRLDKKVQEIGAAAREEVDARFVTAMIGAGSIIDDGVSFLASGDNIVSNSIATVQTIYKHYLNPWMTQNQIAARAHAMKAFEEKFEDWNMGWLFKQEGTLMNLLNNIQEFDSVKKVVEQFGLLNQKLDQARETRIAAIGKDILNKLDELKRKDQETLTKSLLDLDIRVLYKEYGTDGLKELMEDQGKVEAEINRKIEELDKLIENKGIMNYYKAQTQMLGKYLVTHVGDKTLNRNAADIARMVGAGQDKAVNREPNLKVGDNFNKVRALIDEIASLEGIWNTDQDTKTRTAEIIESHTDGVKEIISYHQMYADDNKVYRHVHQIKDTVVKGELKDLSATYKDHMIAPSGTEADKRAMKKKGFKYYGETGVTGVGIYVSNVAGTASYEKQAVAKINEKKRLHNMVGVGNLLAVDKEAAVANTKVEVNKKIAEHGRSIEEQMKTGTAPEMDGFVPIRDKGDNVVNFGITVNKDLYADAMQQDRKAPITLGKMIAEIKEKEMAGVLNAKVLGAIYDDMDTNYVKDGSSKNGREYIEIGPNATTKPGSIAEEYSKEIWKNMPQNIRAKILQRGKGEKYIAVRRDLADMYFGSRAPSILNARLPFTERTIKQNLLKHNLGAAVKSIQLAGDIWEELVSMIKVDVVIKTGEVIIDNIWSNFNYSVALGQWPWEVAAGQAKMFKATKDYLDTGKQMIELENKIKRRIDPRENAIKLKQLRERQQDNAVHPLMEAGLFTAVLEDISMKDLQTDSRFDKFADKYLEKIPEVIRDGAAAVYMTERTPLFRMNMMAVQYSDFVARANRYHYLLAQGQTHQTALKMVTDEFVNYNLIAGKGFRWADKMGIGMFFKYFFGASKNMAHKLKNRPTAMLGMDLLLDMPNPSDAMVWNKDMMYNVYDPIDILFDKTRQNLMPPSLLENLGLI